jgi:hypothetical protein
MAQELNTKTYWASSENGQYEFEVEFLEETEFGDFKVRCIDDDEILILTGYLWTLDLMTEADREWV